MGKKKGLTLSTAEKREAVYKNNSEISLNRQCELLSLSKGSLYYEPVKLDPYTQELMELIDRQYLETPFYGSRKMSKHLSRQGKLVNRKRVQSLMRTMGLYAVYPKPKMSQKNKEHKIYPYLLKGLKIDRPNMVWSTDITYVPLAQGFLYLVAVIDWYSRYVLSWKLSNTMDVAFCVDALEEALEKGRPSIFNTDQGSQFTSKEFTQIQLDKNIQISMDGRGRYLDNIFIERLWRTVKYEEIYLKGYETVLDAETGLERYFPFYNTVRPHQNLAYRTPEEVHFL